MELSESCSIRRHRVLLAACGSVAAIKFGHLCHGFSTWADVKAVATPPALRFIDTRSIPNNVPLYTDVEEWSSWNGLDDSVLHIQLRHWADTLVIAPLSANTLAKMVGGVCDNLLTCIVRSWDESKPIFIAPSMNTCMWMNPFTEKHLVSLDEMGINLIPPVITRNGSGAMAETTHINMQVQMFFQSRGPPPASAHDDDDDDDV